jgi:selenocysteine lyase/cysteine desulfurase
MSLPENACEGEFALSDGLIHLNHAGVSPWPRRTAEAVKAFAEENVACGSLHYDRWLRVEHELREQLRVLLNAPSAGDIALVKNTSEALSFVAAGLEWRSGDNIVTADEEFPSNRIVWEALADRGVELREAAIGRSADPEAALFSGVDSRTRLIAVSSVQFGSGLRMDLRRIGEFCRDRGILFCVDAIQSIGAVRFDVQDSGADFAMADGHKWMLGPEGLGVFYSRPEAREMLRLTEYGWHMVERVGVFDERQWVPASSARRFECGSPNMIGIHALHASLSLLLDVGMDHVERLLLERTAWLQDRLNSLVGVELVTPTLPGRFAGIVTFRTRTDPARLYQSLSEGGVLCAPRSGGIRFSPHFHTPPAHLEGAVDLVSRCLSQG